MSVNMSETIEAAASKRNKRAFSNPMFLPKPRKDREDVKCMCAYMRMCACVCVFCFKALES